MRDCYCTVNLDQEEVFRTKIVEKSLWYVPGDLCFSGDRSVVVSSSGLV